MIEKQNTSSKNRIQKLVEDAVRTAVSSSIRTTQTEPIVNPTPIPDPVQLQMQSKYKTAGLTVTSNNTSIIPRDAAGNIILAENQQNPLLVIEPVATKITTDSVLKVLDTRFNYYKFPVTIIERSGSNLDFDTALDLQSEIDYSSIEDDLTIPLTYDSKGQPNGWSRINTSYENDWFYNNGSLSGPGFRQLPFSSKKPFEIKNVYMLTQDAIDILREQKKTLRFRIHVQARCNIPNPTAFSIDLERGNPKAWRPWLWAHPQLTAYSHHEDNGYPSCYMEYILDANDMVDGDRFVVNAVSGNPCWSLDGNAWWEVRVVNIPRRKPLIGINDTSGVYDMNGSSLLPVRLYRRIDGNPIEIGAKFPGSGVFRLKNDPKFNYAAEAQKYTDKYGILG